jgi:hypothetical protein
VLPTTKELAAAERRQEKRYETKTCDVVILTAEPEMTCRGSIVDVSRSGLRIRSDCKLAANSTVTLRFGGTVVAGRIVYCSLNQDGTFDSGVRICEVDPA